MTKNKEIFKIAVISGKLGDVDGVSLEVDKWISIFKKLGHEIYTIAGSYRHPVVNVDNEKQLEVEELRFDSPDQKYFENLVFPFLSKRPAHLSETRLDEIKTDMIAKGKEVAHKLYEIIKEHEIDVIIAENTNAMPMTLLGGIAVHELATENRVATIFHHHDFWWERSRFSGSLIDDLLDEIMPPNDLGTEHVVISSYAAHILKSIKRVKPTVVPNCEDFDDPVEWDDYNKKFREELGYKEDDIIICQPTRIVPRKRIEDSVHLVGRFIEKYPELKDRTHFVISLYQGDELDSTYIDDIKGLAVRLGVKIDLIAERVASIRCKDDKGRLMFTNRDVLINSDLVTYLPIWEGFGNALLEAVAAKAPIVTTTYLVYKTDIKAAGMDNIEVRDIYDEYGRLVIPDRVVDDMYYALNHKEEIKKRVEKNFAVANEEFGFGALERILSELLDNYSDEIKASRRRLKKSKVNYYV